MEWGDGLQRGYQGVFEGDRAALYVICGGSFTTASICQCSQNCIPLKTVNVTLCKLYSNLKKKKKKTWTVEFPAWERTSAPPLPSVWPWTRCLSFWVSISSSVHEGSTTPTSQVCYKDSVSNPLSIRSHDDHPAKSHSMKCPPRGFCTLPPLASCHLPSAHPGFLGWNWCHTLRTLGSKLGWVRTWYYWKLALSPNQ